MRKRWMRRAVLSNTDRLVAGNGCLEVDEVAQAAVAVLDLSDCAVTDAVRILLFANGADVDVDDCAEIGFAHADEVAQSSELQILIALRITSKDHFAAATDELIDAEVLEVAPVADV